MHALDSLSPFAVRLTRLAILLLGYGALAGCYELVALQVPGSPLHIGVLPVPVGALRELALMLALLLFVAAALLRWAFGDSAPRTARVASVLLSAGALIALAAQTYGALHGMHGVQMSDLRPDARAVFYARHLGLFLFTLGFMPIGLGVLRRRAPT